MSSLSNFSKNRMEKDEKICQEYEKVKDLSRDEAQVMLRAEVEQQKQNGTFDFDALQRQVRSLESLMPQQDYQNLIKLLQTLK